MSDKNHYESIILGAGPAGMTAAVYSARKQMDVLVITENIGGQTTWSADIENYLGFRFVTGPDLVAKFESHVSEFNVPREFAKVTRLTRPGPNFSIETDSGRIFSARSVIVATGKSPRMLGIPGEKEYSGRGVTYCATCDGPLFAGKRVLVAGGGNSGLDAVVQLMKICPKVYLAERGPKLRADEVMINRARTAENVEILLNTAVVEVYGDQFVNAVMLKSLADGQLRRLDVEGVFVEVGLVPNTDFIKDAVRLNYIGEIPVDCAARTGIPGLYAAGDVTDVPEKQIIIAAGDGAKAALGAYSYIVRLPVIDDWGRMAT